MNFETDKRPLLAKIFLLKDNYMKIEQGSYFLLSLSALAVHGFRGLYSWESPFVCREYIC